MSQNARYVSRDLVATSLSGRIDWHTLEELVYAVLVDDDLPTLRRIGGGNDYGVDAESVTYEVEGRKRTIVQVSSAAAQKSKVLTTIQKLKKNSIEPEKLVYVTNTPVSAGNKREIIAAAEELGIDVDIRDQDYLAGQLSRAGSPIYARFFGSVEEQRDKLFSKGDALGAASDALQHSLLATMGAFVISNRARIARKTLFDNTVLAAIASRNGGAKEEILEDVRRLCPGEAVDMDRVAQAIRRLVGDGAAIEVGDGVECAPEVLARTVAVGTSARQGFRELVLHVFDACERVQKLTQAQEGFLERNVRKLLLVLLRVSGPAALEDQGLGVWFLSNERADFREIIGRNMPQAVIKPALSAVASFVGSEVGVRALSPLIRSYGALAIRNVDPVGKSWQQSVLSRNSLALDADAVLFLLVKELPEHLAVKDSLRALQAEGVQIVVSGHVLDEVVDHVGRAHRTFSRFRNTLLRMPPEAVLDQVWSVVVRGFYFFSRNGNGNDFERYQAQYWDENAPRHFIEMILSKRLEIESEDLAAADVSWEPDMLQITTKAIEQKEANRPKAMFRDEVAMAARVRSDVCMAFNVATRVDRKLGGQVRGYVVTTDSLFRFIEAQGEWGGRPSVAIPTLSLPQLASFICGSPLDDSSAVELLFHDVSVAAANEMADEIVQLAAIGVDLAGVSLERLDWDLRESLKRRLDDLEAATSSETEDSVEMSADSAVKALETAKAAGYGLAMPVETVIARYSTAQQALGELQSAKVASEELLKEFVRSAIEGSSSKARARLRRIANQLGIENP